MFADEKYGQGEAAQDDKIGGGVECGKADQGVPQAIYAISEWINLAQYLESSRRRIEGED